MNVRLPRTGRYGLLRGSARFHSGASLTGVLAISALAILFVGLFGFVAWRSVTLRGANTEIQRMRQVYMAAYLYSQDWNSAWPSNLALVRNRLADDSLLLVPEDPLQQSACPCPLDPFLPDRLGSPVRLSDSYLGAWIGTEDGPARWDSVPDDRRIGVIANGFTGSVRAEGGFRVQANGVIRRVTLDGSFRTLPRASPPRTTVQDLFLRTE